MQMYPASQPRSDAPVPLAIATTILAQKIRRGRRPKKRKEKEKIHHIMGIGARLVYPTPPLPCQMPNHIRGVKGGM